ncbi:hypothetical protein [Synechococcus sp. BIOS-U3-1]|uniref:hypothetical protein n=1 Tax=Synechococcus sp. BIOS-U3-1 TaxID=1400865 RepID=UPI0016472D5D|nr:hypothetical protein [Synechococcus sp. BIOS-U3-1]
MTEPRLIARARELRACLRHYPSDSCNTPEVEAIHKELDQIADQLLSGGNT